MKVHGLTPGQGPQPERTGGKKPASPTGKSFSDLLKKAAGGPPVQGTGAQEPVQGHGAGPSAFPKPPPAADAAPPPAGDHLDTIKFRLQSGYYKDSKVDDALSDKLSDYFDDLA